MRVPRLFRGNARFVDNLPARARIIAMHSRMMHAYLNGISARHIGRAVLCRESSPGNEQLLNQSYYWIQIILFYYTKNDGVRRTKMTSNKFGFRTKLIFYIDYVVFGTLWWRIRAYAEDDAESIKELVANSLANYAAVDVSSDGSSRVGLCSGCIKHKAVIKHEDIKTGNLALIESVYYRNIKERWCGELREL